MHNNVHYLIFQLLWSTVLLIIEKRCRSYLWVETLTIQVPNSYYNLLDPLVYNQALWSPIFLTQQQINPHFQASQGGRQCLVFLGPFFKFLSMLKYLTFPKVIRYGKYTSVSGRGLLWDSVFNSPFKSKVFLDILAW